MSGRGIGDMGKPRKKYRIAHGKLDTGEEFDFETKYEAQRCDQDRCTRLSRIAKDKTNGLKNRKRLRRIIEKISEGSSVASRTYMRWHRKRLGGALWELVDQHPDTMMFTLLLSTWVYPGGHLNEADPIKMRDALRTALRRKGASSSDGWLFGYIDGEFDPFNDCFRLHMHGLVSGGMIEVVKSMNGVRNLRSAHTSCCPNAVLQPIRCTKIVRTAVKAITYCLKSYWCQRLRGPKGESPQTRLSGKQAIRDDLPFAEHLLWLGQWEIQDLSLVMGMRVINSRFRVRKKCT